MIRFLQNQQLFEPINVELRNEKNKILYNENFTYFPFSDYPIPLSFIYDQKMLNMLIMFINF